MRACKKVPPLNIDSANFSRKLGLYSKNAEHTAQFLACGVEDYQLEGFLLPPGFRLVKSRSEEQYRIVTTENEKPYTAYAVKLIAHSEITHPHRAITQVMVWRTPSLIYKAVVSGFPQLFFRHILDTSNIVVSDSEQTGDGQRFWLTMLDWAFHSNYQLYVADGTEGEDWPKHRIESLDDLENRWLEYAWGGDKDVHRHRRLIISKAPLEAA